MAIDLDIAPLNQVYMDAGFTIVGAGAEIPAIDDPIGSPDDDATYIENSAGSLKRAICSGDVSSIPAGATINYVRITFRAYTMNGAAVGAYLRMAGGGFYQIGAGQSGTGWTTSACDATTNPISTAQWTVNEVKGLSGNYMEGFGVGLTGSTGPARCTQVFMTINYTEPVAPEYAVAGGAGSLAGVHDFVG